MSVLDFVVIGAPNAGVGVLRGWLGSHPQVRLPVSRRAVVSIDGSRYVFGPEWFEPGVFGDLEPGVLRGIVSPGHMSGRFALTDTAQPIESIAAGMVRTLPDVKLIAVLRDPIQRAIAHHQQATRHGLERRTLDRALREQLTPGALHAARQRPREVTGYLVWSEYGRILAAYRKHFPQSQLLILLASDLETKPRQALKQIAAHLQIKNSWGRQPPTPNHHPQITTPQTTSLLQTITTALPDLEANTLTKAIHAWNQTSQLDPAQLDPTLHAQLQAHYATDTTTLQHTTNTQPPWAHTKPAVAAPASRSPEVSIVVLVHETPREAQSLLASIIRHTHDDYEIVLVDNGSGSVAAAALAAIAQTHGARLVRLDENLVFSAAMNVGIQASRGEEIALLNSDIVVTPNWLANLRVALRSAPDVAIVGPRSNLVHAPQGPIWVEDISDAGIERFGRAFNHSDPTRWFDYGWLSGFAMLARRSALQASGGFDEDIPWFGLEDRELCSALIRAGWRVLTAGDTFIYHIGHRTAELTGFNRTATRFGREHARAGAGVGADATLVKDSDGEMFEVHDGVAFHIETALAFRLIRGGRPVRAAGPGELAQLPVGPPIGLCRPRDTEEVWVLHGGWRRRVTGDRHRIRRTMGVSIAEPDELEALPVGPDVAIEEALAPVPELKPILPGNPAEIRPDRLADADQVTQEIVTALRESRGYGLIVLDVAAALVLNEGIWPVGEQGADLMAAGGGEDPGAAAAALRRAIVDADTVGVEERRDRFEGASLLEALLFHLDLYPRLRCSSEIAYELLGIELGTGLVGGESELLESLDGHPIALAVPSALVGQAGWDRRRQLRSHGLDVRLTVAVDEIGDVDQAFLELAEHRDLYDAVLVAGDLPAKALSGRLARELDVVAIDIGHALDATLHPRYAAPTSLQRSGVPLERYFRQVNSPAPLPAHELEGRLVRQSGEAATWYVERGRARALMHRELLHLFDEPPVELEPEDLARLPRGVPLFIAYERFAGPYLPVGGKKRPVKLSLPFTVLEQGTATLRSDPRGVRWYPGARNQLVPDETTLDDG